MKILVADDDPELAGLLGYALRQAGFDVVHAYDGLQALEKVDLELPDLLLLDVNLPSLDGFGVLAQLRTRSQLPVIMLTVRDGEDEEVRGLNLGADDYLGKPFSPRSLLARIRAVLRRRGVEVSASSLSCGDLTLDLDSQIVAIDGGAAIQLSLLETRLLQRLMVERGRVVRSERLISAVWGDRDSGDRQALKQLVRRLRTRIEESPGEPTRLLSAPGVGYRLVGGNESDSPSGGTADSEQPE